MIMKTWEAIKLLEEGCEVRRTSWEEKDNYIYLDSNGSLRHSNGNRYRLEHHIKRDDWEIYFSSEDERIAEELYQKLIKKLK